MLKIANQEDFNTLKPICKKFFEYSPYKEFPMADNLLDEYLKTYLTQPPFKLIVMDMDGDKLKGFIAFEYGNWLFSPVSCGIEKALWVEPEYREGDTAKELLKAFEGWADEMKCSILQLSSLEGEFAKVLDKFYKKMKYTKIENLYLKKVG